MHRRGVSPYREMAIGVAPETPQPHRPLVGRVLFGAALAASTVAVVLGASGAVILARANL